MFCYSRKSDIIYLVLLLAAVAVTLAVMFVLVPRENRTDKFWITLVSLLLAEGCAFGFQISLSRSDTGRHTSFPFQFATAMMVMFYGLGVILLALIAATSIPFRYLAAMHLIWFLLLLIGLGLALLGGSYIGKISQKERDERSFMAGFKLQFSDLLGMLKGIDSPDVVAICEALQAFAEELKYAAA